MKILIPTGFFARWQRPDQAAAGPAESFIVHTMRVGLEWQPHDVWVGLYWTRKPGGMLHIWLCLLPCLPLHVEKSRQRVYRNRRGDDE